MMYSCIVCTLQVGLWGVMFELAHRTAQVVGKNKKTGVPGHRGWGRVWEVQWIHEGDLGDWRHFAVGFEGSNAI